jgi:hypothetical protein
MQACVSQLHSLTRFEAAYISTPLQHTALDDLFASLPSLQAVRLHLCTAEEPYSHEDSDATSDSDSLWREKEPYTRTRPDDFPLSLLRCCHTSPTSNAVSTAVAICCTSYLTVHMLTVESNECKRSKWLPFLLPAGAHA